MVQRNIKELDSTFVRTLEMKSLTRSSNRRTITINDRRKIQQKIKYIRANYVEDRTGILENFSTNNTLHKAMSRSHIKLCQRYMNRNGSIPYLEGSQTQHLMSKIEFVLDYIEEQASFIADKCSVTTMVSIDDFCEAVCDCSFSAVAWNKEEALPLISNILEAQMFGDISLYGSNNIVRYMYNNKRIKDQAFGSLYESKTEHCWIKFAKYLKTRKYSNYKPMQEYSIARSMIQCRKDGEKSYITDVFNLLGITSIEHRIFLTNEPSIIEFSRVLKESININNVYFYLDTILKNLQGAQADISVGRGLLSTIFPMTNLEELENALLASSYVKSIKTKRKLGASKKNLRHEYRGKGYSHLMDCIPSKERRIIRFCRARKFYYKLYRSNRKPFECKDSPNIVNIA